MRQMLLAASLALVLTAPLLAEPATVLYVDRSTAIEHTLTDPTDLWVVPEDLTRINDFVLKPEGACIDDLCVPIRQDRDSEIFVTREEQGWINVTELADRLKQRYVVDADARVWGFGEIPATRSAFLKQAMAPDFTLPDRSGNPVSLADFRGKKVMLLSWASW